MSCPVSDMVTVLTKVSLHTVKYQSNVRVKHKVQEIKSLDRHTERRAFGLPTTKMYYDSNVYD
jgi:hypothetical protein